MDLIDFEGGRTDSSMCPSLHPMRAVGYPLIFHPANDNEFEEEEEEMIPIVNPNKHIQNYEDGGRRRKNRHISKMDQFKNGKKAFIHCCKDLFGVKQQQPPADELATP